MKKNMIFVLSLVLILCCCFALAEDTHLAVKRMDIQDENYVLFENEEGIREVYGYAKVTNSGDAPFYIEGGVLHAYETEKTEISQSAFSPCQQFCEHAKSLEPGEYTYVTFYAQLEEPSAEPVKYSIDIDTEDDFSCYTERLPSVSEIVMEENDDWNGENHILVTVENNNTAREIYGLSVAAAVIDPDGNILFVLDDSLTYSQAIGPNGTLVFRLKIPQSFINLHSKEKLESCTVDAIAYANFMIVQ